MIWERGKEDRRHHLEVEEIKVRAILGAIYASQGNQAGVSVSQQFRLQPQERVQASAATIRRKFPVDQAVGGLITPEEIAAEVARLAGDAQ